MTEKLLVIELVGKDIIGVSFLGFFDNDIKEIIKSTPNARYDQ